MGRMAEMLRPIGLSGAAQSRTYRAIRSSDWTFGEQGRRSRERLRALHGSETGADGFIVGTGPSLLKTDFSKIRGRPTIGLNRLFLGFQQFDFVPDRLMCINTLMIEQSAELLIDLPCPLVAAWACRSHLRKNDNVTFVRTVDSTHFSKTLMDTVSTGATVTYAALQLAYWLGWKSVTLVGVDHSYSLNAVEAKAGAHGTVSRDGHDRNHFHSGYMPKGDFWQVPDLAQSEAAYTKAGEAFKLSGRAVFDATVDGNLRIFPRSPIDLRAGQPMDRFTAPPALQKLDNTGTHDG